MKEMKVGERRRATERTRGGKERDDDVLCWWRRGEGERAMVRGSLLLVGSRRYLGERD